MKKILSLSIATLLILAMAVFGAGCTTEDAVGAGIAGIWIFCSIIAGLIGLFLFILWIITIVDAAKRKNEEFPGAGENTKTVWLVILIASWVVGLNWLAAIIYYFAVMKKMPRKK